ncbi:hypothetical protein AusDCA_2550 [Desulfitobacterium sp. AusDCA]
MHLYSYLHACSFKLLIIPGKIYPRVIAANPPERIRYIDTIRSHRVKFIPRDRHGYPSPFSRSYGIRSNACSASAISNPVDEYLVGALGLSDIACVAVRPLLPAMTQIRLAFSLMLTQRKKKVDSVTSGQAGS